jgi:hypothetical protein
MTSAQANLNNLSEDILDSIAMLLEAFRESSALILLYTGIDVFGALNTDDGVSTQASFVRWSEKYMDPATKLGCTGLELYSARCGLLHTLSPLTRLTKSGKAREFVYVTYPPFLPQQNVSGGPFIVHVPLLWLAFRDGTREFVKETDLDQSQAQRVSRNLSNLYFTRTN